MQDIKENLTSEVSNYIVSVCLFFFFSLNRCSPEQKNQSEVVE